ncbi:hypothetical protein UVI_02021840 [Ustilaginoidea virens]|uniref:GST N-terminal domain-containing protein n=1 Tax=Ustilaginoidea virens TaxID=1159556 RepID=A0A1B5L0W3_USTVR|nr:hypothetical protein UVI_02021840 [Ustilaginoidea virens]
MAAHTAIADGSGQRKSSTALIELAEKPWEKGPTARSRAGTQALSSIRPQDNSRSIAIKAVAKANNLDLKISEVEFGKPTAEHLKANGLGKIPTFVGEDGFTLSECIAVAIYVTSQNEKTTLLGKTKQE